MTLDAREARTAGTRALGWVRCAPLTTAYLLALVVTTILVHRLPRAIVHRLLWQSSTNLHQLDRVPVRVLVASAFWVADGHVLGWLALLGVVGGLAESRIGSVRTACIFIAGHVGASLLVAAGLVIALAVGVVHRSIVDMVDVGPSYGFAALAAAVSLRGSRRWRIWSLVALGAWLVTTSSTSSAGRVTAAGHLTAIAIGFLCVLVVRTRVEPTSSSAGATRAPRSGTGTPSTR